jgi:hypothetical protein
MYNFQSEPELFKALQDYYTEELTEEAIIKRQHAARAAKAKTPERLLGRIGAGLTSFRLRLKAQDQPEIATSIHQSC